MRRVQRKAWELLARTESDGDHRASIVALREVRECPESLGEMLSQVGGKDPGPLSQWSKDDLKAELNRRGEPTEMVIRFGNGKEDFLCDRPCCTAERNEAAARMREAEPGRTKWLKKVDTYSHNLTNPGRKICAI
jgi:hypothetical protein